MQLITTHIMYSDDTHVVVTQEQNNVAELLNIGLPQI